MPKTETMNSVLVTLGDDEIENIVREYLVKIGVSSDKNAGKMTFLLGCKPKKLGLSTSPDFLGISIQYGDTCFK